ncbi:MAG TPA: lytic transglycosylase domain-containing protein [Bacillota bacterium]|nr:lytic transglycosylase domain-containing protein [Bacillota bacterium]
MDKKRKLGYIGLLAAVMLLYMVILNIPGLLKLIYPLKYKDEILEYGHLHKIDPSLIAALIKTESNFKPYAESRKGAKGLMQITSSTGEWIAGIIGIKDFSEDMLFDAGTNIKLGSWYIKYLTGYYSGDFELIFAAYNGGSGNVDKWLKDRNISSNGITLDIIPFPETEKFLVKLKKNYNVYKRIYRWEAVNDSE